MVCLVMKLITIVYANRWNEKEMYHVSYSTPVLAMVPPVVSTAMGLLPDT